MMLPRHDRTRVRNRQTACWLPEEEGRERKALRRDGPTLRACRLGRLGRTLSAVPNGSRQGLLPIVAEQTAPAAEAAPLLGSCFGSGLACVRLAGPTS